MPSGRAGSQMPRTGCGPTGAEPALGQLGPGLAWQRPCLIHLGWSAPHPRSPEGRSQVSLLAAALSAPIQKPCIWTLPVCPSPECPSLFLWQVDRKSCGRAAAHPGNLVGLWRACCQQPGHGLPVHVCHTQLLTGEGPMGLSAWARNIRRIVSTPQDHSRFPSTKPSGVILPALYNKVCSR